MSAGRTLLGIFTVLARSDAARAKRSLITSVRLLCPALMIVLSGCSGGPSTSDVFSTLTESLENYRYNTKAVEKVDDLNCKEAAEQPGFVCTYTLTVHDKRDASIRTTTVQQMNFLPRHDDQVALDEARHGLGGYRSVTAIFPNIIKLRECSNERDFDSV